jgi:hypothetical protein
VYIEKVQDRRRCYMPAASSRSKAAAGGDSLDVWLADGRGAQDPSHSYASGDIAGAPCSGDRASGPGNGAEAAHSTSDYSGRVRLLSEGLYSDGGSGVVGDWESDNGVMEITRVGGRRRSGWAFWVF